jgi:hypothetical protein
MHPKGFKKVWTPAFAGVTTLKAFYEAVKAKEIEEMRMRKRER